MPLLLPDLPEPGEEEEEGGAPRPAGGADGGERGFGGRSSSTGGTPGRLPWRTVSEARAVKMRAQAAAPSIPSAAAPTQAAAAPAPKASAAETCVTVAHMELLEVLEAVARDRAGMSRRRS